MKSDSSETKNNLPAGYVFLKHYRMSKEDKEAEGEKYVVLDVETTGLDPLKDDVIVLSAFDPLTGLTYSHFFPLEKKKKVEEGARAVNGLSKRRLNKEEPVEWNQEDFNYFYETFHLDKRQVLIYSSFDEKFLKVYFSEHGITGFSSLHFFNIMRKIASNPFEDHISKDNLCLALGIEGVKKVHNGLNDCYLEWKLYKTMTKYPGLYVKNHHVYALHPSYRIPASSLNDFVRTDFFMANRQIEAQFSLVEEDKLDFSSYINEDSALFKKAFSGLLKVTYLQDNEYALQNRYLLTLLGLMPGYKESKGKKETEKEEETENQEKLLDLEKLLAPYAEKWKESLFHNAEVSAHELVKQEPLHSFGYCDFSSLSTSLTLKVKKTPFKDGVSKEQQMSDYYAYQMYVTSNLRSSYLLLIEKDKMSLYKVSFLPYGTIYKREGR